jgi:ParB-like chromosome segregation protein Spo0J
MSQKNELPKTKWELAEVPIDLVDMPANPTNKTKQASLTAQGFAERIILVPNGERYKVQNGRRRIADAKALGESVVPALVRHTDEK